MKIYNSLYNSPYFDHEDGLDIMIMDDPLTEVREVYYRKPGYPYIFAFGLPESKIITIQLAINLAKLNASKFAVVLFK